MSHKTRGKKALYAEVDPEIASTIAQIASATGLTKAQTIETMVRNTRLGMDGTPRDWDVTHSRSMNQELPLADTA
jgi:hypothetical protein